MKTINQKITFSRTLNQDMLQIKQAAQMRRELVSKFAVTEAISI